MQEREQEGIPVSVASLIDLIWILHPLCAYSPEIGHVLLHAYVLASENEELPLLDVMGELFLRQMILPKVIEVRDWCNLLYAKKTKSEVNAASLEFWNKMPSIATVMKLLSQTVPQPEQPEEHEVAPVSERDLPFTVKEPEKESEQPTQSQPGTESVTQEEEK